MAAANIIKRFKDLSNLYCILHRKSILYRVLCILDALYSLSN